MNFLREVLIRRMCNDLGLIKFLLALSESLDLFSPVLARHQITTAIISLKIAEEMNLSRDRLVNIVSTALIHDIGALNPEEKLALKENRFESRLEQHCFQGKNLLSKVPCLERQAMVTRLHHMKWENRNQIDDKSLVMEAQIVSLSDTVERFMDRTSYILNQSEHIKNRISSQSVRNFDPLVVEAFLSAAAKDSFWLDLVFGNARDIIGSHPFLEPLKIPEAQIKDLSELLKSMVDFRSHFTATHSTGVSTIGARISEILGLSAEETRMIKIAGNLHDIGKITIPSSILEKPEKLSFLEIREMRQHAYHTYGILKRCGFPEQIIEAASFHHEKLDGSGYPFQLSAKDLSYGARTVAVADILTALAEDRPYRKGMTKIEIMKVLDKEVSNMHLDGDIVEIVRNNYYDIVTPAMEQQVRMEREFKEKFFAA